MDPKFWIERWQKGETGFHRAAPHDQLVRFWPTLGLAAGSPVFVPLCGKSVDMAWLAEAGHRVIGAELSELAVDSFFAERGLEPEVEARPGFAVKRAGPYEIWCGDIFALPAAVTANIAAVYDRAALVAFPPAEQPRYVAKLTELTPRTAPIALVGLAFNQSFDGPPFATGLDTVVALFGPSHEVAVLEARDGLATSPNLRDRGVDRLVESLYLLRRRTA